MATAPGPSAGPAGRGRAAGVARLGLFFAALFVGSGASMPFMPVWFRAHGLGAAEIGVILAAPHFAQALTGSALAIGADLFRLRRTAIATIAAGAGLAYLSLAFVQGFWAWLIVWFLGFTLMGVLGPLVDVLTLREARARGFAYTLPRGVGSAAYLFGNLGMGLALARFGPAAVLVWTVAAAALASLAAAAALPPTPSQDGAQRVGARELFTGLGRLARAPAFILCLAAVGLIQASHGFYYGFSILVWRAQGLGAWGGLLWATATGAEILFMWMLEPWRRRLGAERLLIVGGLGALVRWVALGLSPPLWLLFPLQALHAFSFAAAYLASLRLVERLSPPETASAAQSLCSGLSNGVLMGLATAASGELFKAFGAGGYFAMALVAGAGILLALKLAAAREADRKPAKV